MREIPLLHLTSRPDALKHWLHVNCVPAVGVTGMVIDEFSTAKPTLRSCGQSSETPIRRSLPFGIGCQSRVNAIAEMAAKPV
jgi:hypothetical protein